MEDSVALVKPKLNPAEKKIIEMVLDALPVYRRVTTEDERGKKRVHFELASSKWKRSDARDVTKWFEYENRQKSPDEKNGQQLRRVCRLAKKFARSRESWKGENARGFAITKLVTECYYPSANRDDESFFWTMVNITADYRLI